MGMSKKSIPIFFLAVILSEVLVSCKFKESSLPAAFTKISPSYSGVSFSNQLIETDDFNVIEYLYFYNGGGVAVGDINNDGLPDIYFTSNQSSNKLYLNRGGFRFEDITDKAGVKGIGNWSTGVTMVDVNGDGLLDIYLCAVGGYKGFTGQNQLLINNGDLTFSDQTEQYGLSFQGFSTHAVFFDADNDGDLDLYLLNHSVHTSRSYGKSSLRFQHDTKAGDRFYLNNLIPTGKIGFTEASKQAGILTSQIGYGLGVGISDLNNDGYADIYVANDFHENDYLYINNCNGTFRLDTDISLPHTSRFSMGLDIGDVNLDGWFDIITLDMLPRDEAVLKSSAGEDPYEIVQFKLNFGYGYQVSRNTLQLNQGLQHNGQLVFSDIAPLMGVEATDWSWSPLFADFDSDGYLDLFVANGIVKRPNDLDYINYISLDSVQLNFSDAQLISEMPSGKVSNYFFRNDLGDSFENVTSKWIGADDSFSTGAAYADLDNDGDLDLIINNVNDVATLLRNDIVSQNYIHVKFDGNEANRHGIGAKVMAYVGGKKIIRELQSSRGWQSSVEPKLHLGLGSASIIDSLIVVWPGGNYQKLFNVTTNQSLTLHESNASPGWNYGLKKQKVFLKQDSVLDFTHRENPFVAFERERLLPSAATTQGPGLAVGDVTGDGLDDVFICGASGQASKLYIQTESGRFNSVHESLFAPSATAEDVDAHFVDVNNDGGLDILVVSGGQEWLEDTEYLKPRLYLNDGSGSFRLDPDAFPEIYIHGSCIEAYDFDKDGNVDLFIGGRIEAGKYGVSPRSYLLRNDGRGKFIDVSQVALPKSKLGMITDACWHDVNADGLVDLIIVGEWMPITILQQTKAGKFEDMTEKFGLANSQGWWNTIFKRDLNKDGSFEFLVGNAGLNSRLKASVDKPVELFVADIDGNGSLDPVLTYYNDEERYPFISRDNLIKQVPSLKKKFIKYSDFKNVRIEDILEADNPIVIHKKAELFESVMLSFGDQRAVIASLPIQAQSFPIFSFCDFDIDKDGDLDILIGGNLYAVHPDIGRFDAGHGLTLLGDGELGFKAFPISQSGFYVPGEVRRISRIRLADNKEGIIVGRNNNSILIFK